MSSEKTDAGWAELFLEETEKFSKQIEWPTETEINEQLKFLTGYGEAHYSSFERGFVAALNWMQYRLENK